MEELQGELRRVKERWGKEVELSKAEKGTPNFPFPVAVTRYTPRPDSAAAWDCEEVPIRLVIQSADAAAQPVSVEVPDIFPGRLSEEIEKFVEAEWKRQLGRSKKAKSSLWMVETVLEWVEARFVDVLRLVPEYVDLYDGFDDMGMSMRRYTLVGPAPEGEEDEEEEEEEEDEEEHQRRVEEWLAREQARLEAEVDEKFKAGEEARRQAELGVFEMGEKAKKLSKKEMAEANKSRKERSGHRWRKEGAKAHKPVKDEEEVKAKMNKQGKKKVYS